MKRTSVVALGLAAAIGVVAVLQAQNRSSDESAIRAHIESIFDAFIAKDRDKLAATHGREIISTSYDLYVSESGRTRTEKGKATEVFVRRGGRWLNTGWQLAPETARGVGPAPVSRP